MASAGNPYRLVPAHFYPWLPSSPYVFFLSGPLNPARESTEALLG